MELLKQLLQEMPQIEFVYLNDNKEWQLFEHPKFPKRVSRKEVIEESIEENKKKIKK